MIELLKSLYWTWKNQLSTETTWINWEIIEAKYLTIE